MRPLLALLPLALLAGCTLLQEPEERPLAGPTDGYTPTASFLKLHVEREDGSVALLGFDRRDWYAAKIAEMVDKRQLEYVQAQAKPRDILHEYLALHVADPGEVAKLRYDAMGATQEERAAMDLEYEELLRRHLPTPAPSLPPPPAPLAAPPLP